jgi:hypothetical protein
MQGKMGIETRNIIRDSKPYHIIKTLKIICKNGYRNKKILLGL